MLRARLFALAAAAALVTACADPTRSRSLDNPQVAGRTLAEQVCSNCHGLRGASPSQNFPNLAAQQPAYVEAELKSLRDKHRADPGGFIYMWGISRHLTDDQISQLAEYYAAQPPAPRPTAAAANVDLGRKLFAEGSPARNIPACSTCHGETGVGQGPFPRLAAQHREYIYRQLGVLRQGTDNRPLGNVMNGVAHLLTDEEMRSIAAYVESM